MNGADLFCGDAGGDAGVGDGDDPTDAFGDIGYIRLSKKTQRASRFVYAATAKYPGASSANKNSGYRCYC